MGSKRKRATAIPVAPGIQVKSRKRARQIVTAFHRLEEESKRTQTDGALSKTEKKQRLDSIQKTVRDLGGRAAYQSASQLSVSFHNTSKWVLKVLRDQGLLPGKGARRLKVLEVGAINTTLLDCESLSVTAIDLLSRHERIQQKDFFDLIPEEDYDLLVSSMVLNSVPSADKRGDMLRGYAQHLRLGGHLCLMIPKSCLTHPIDNNLNAERFAALLSDGLGFRIVLEHETPKVAFFFCRKEKKTQDLAFLRSWPDCHPSHSSKGQDTSAKQHHHRGGWRKDFAISFSTSTKNKT